MAVPEGGTVLQLKRAVSAQQGADVAPVDRQRVLFGGRILADADSLAAAGVAGDAVVQVMIRAAGF